MRFAMITETDIEAIYPLSPMQQGVVFHSLKDPHAGFHINQMLFRIHGAFDVDTLTRAWNDVIARHAVLRTAFSVSGEMSQVVLRRVKIPIEYQDWSGLSNEEMEVRSRTYLQEDRRQGFDLSQAPAMRVLVIKESELRFQMLWSFHLALMDGWSSAIVQQELLITYGAHRSSKMASLSRPQPFGEYISWLQRQDKYQAERFWQKALGDFSSPTPLPFNGEGRNSSSKRSELTLRLSSDLSGELSSTARRHHVTLSTLLQGAWAILLSRHSGEEDVVFGATVSGRPAELPGVEEMVGLFINTLPVRVQVDPSASLVAWLQKLQDTQSEANQYAYTPLVDIQGCSQVPRGTPLFQSIVVVENYPVGALASSLGSAGMTIQSLGSHETMNYELVWIVGPGKELLIKLCYATDLYEAETIEGMVEQLKVLLENIVRMPEEKIGRLSLVSSAERKRVIEEWNETEVEWEECGRCVTELFEEQVERSPGAVAVVCGEEQLSYQEVNERANQLAHYLRGMGVGPEVRVGLCLERSAEMVVSLLGVLKAGGAYVPLEPSYPGERLSYMLEDAQAAVLVTSEEWLERLEGSPGRRVCLDRDWEEIARQSKANLGVSIDGGNLAYVIYTSGSTGRPKGVGVTHGGVSNYVQGVWEAREVEAGWGWGWVSTVAADLGNTMLFPALCGGGVLQVVGVEESREGRLLAEYSSNHAMDCLKITATHLQSLLSSGGGEVLPGKRLVLGGEVSNWKWVRGLQETNPGCWIWNHYGPTETTVGATMYGVEEGRGGEEGGVPIGKPIANTQVYVLDEEMEAVPVGVPGELYIGGAGLARGYLGRADLTAERFVPNPFGKGGGERLYRTGDRARWRRDGNLEYLGRLDEQVKIRGFRIELGEIEAVLREHGGVRQAVVVVREGEPGEQRLVAYVVPEEGKVPDARELRSHLQARLPEYMVPWAYVVMESLPLTANGKLDRRGLPQPERERGSESSYVAPRTAVEEILCGIWAEVLRLERVGVEDNFFELGGHSLLATQVISRVREVFETELPLQSLFEEPTVAGLGKVVEAGQKEEGQREGAPRLVAVGREEALPLSYAQQRLWVIDQLEPGQATYNIPYALRLHGELEEGALEKSLAEVVRRHEVLRTSFPVERGEAVQRIEAVAEVRLERVDLRGMESEEEREEAVRELAKREGERGFDLGRGPLLRTTLVKLGEKEHVLLVTLHHIVSDGWSLGILIREMTVLYGAMREGKGSPLKELPIQYGDFAVWQRGWLQGEVLEEQLGYWRKQLAEIPVLELPTDKVRPGVASHRGGWVRFELSEELTGKLKELSRREGVTLFMMLLAAFQVLLSRWAGQDDVVVGTDVANRNRLETEGLIGFFVNQLVLRTDMGGNPSFREVLRRVREVTLGAYAHQDLPFEKLVEELAPVRDISRNPLFQVKLVFQAAPAEERREGK